MIKQSRFYNDKIKFEINDTYNSIETACKARLDLFNLSAISNYEKVLYLDTDIVIKDSIDKVFGLIRKDILYVLEEGDIREDENYGGTVLFGDEIDNYDDKTAFTIGILKNNTVSLKFHKTLLFHLSPYKGIPKL
jgi:lipopolysaccharide biosynthesis glycosyltransferase